MSELYRIFSEGDSQSIKDPGASQTITVDRSPAYCGLTSAAAEARTLGRPTRRGAIVTVNLEVDGGDVTLTVTGGYNEAGDTTIILSAAAQSATFVAIATRSGVTVTYSWRLVSSFMGNQALAVPAGAGVLGDAEVYESSVVEIGGVITTRILIDLTGLDSSGTAGDIIGDLAGGAAHIGQITAARNGTIMGGTVRCLEIPTGGDPDVDLWAANEATGAFDDAISGLTGEAQLVNTGDWTLEEDTLTAFPTDGQYLYLTTGATDDATYTAGKFLITLYGFRA